MKVALIFALIAVSGYSTGLLLELSTYGDDSKIQRLMNTGSLDEQWLPFVRAAESYNQDGLVASISVDSDSMGFLRTAYLLGPLTNAIDSAYLDFTIATTEVHPTDGGHDFFRNEITECIFKTDDTIEFETCVICQLTDIDGNVVADGRTDLPGGFDPLTDPPVTVAIDNFWVDDARDVRNIHDVIVAVCDTEGGGEGCTPGFWKQSQHFGHWVTFSPGDDYETVFGLPAGTLTIKDKQAPGGFITSPTLLEALGAQGGAQNALARHSVAALLNAASSVDFAFSTGQVIILVQDAFAGGDFETPKSLLATENELGCPLSGIDPGDEGAAAFSETGGVDSTTYDGSTATPYEKKQHSLQQLNLLVAEPGIDQSTIDLLNAAILNLDDIVYTEGYWVNDYHVDIITGQFVLDYSRDATTALIDITTAPTESQTFKDSVELVIDELVAADGILAQTAVDDVGFCGGKNSKIDNHLSGAQTKLNQAQQDSNDKKYDMAIQKFYDAWYEAFLATESCPAGYWTELDGYVVVG